MKLIITIILSCFMISSLISQEEAVTKDGKTVILYSDFTYKFKETETKKDSFYIIKEVDEIFDRVDYKCSFGQKFGDNSHSVSWSLDADIYMKEKGRDTYGEYDVIDFFIDGLGCNSNFSVYILFEDGSKTRSITVYDASCDYDSKLLISKKNQLMLYNKKLKRVRFINWKTDKQFDYKFKDHEKDYFIKMHKALVKKNIKTVIK